MVQIQKNLLSDYNIGGIMAVFKDFSNEYIFDENVHDLSRSRTV